MVGINSGWSLWFVVCVCVVWSWVVSICFTTPRNIAHQPPVSMGFSRQAYRNGLPCPPPGDLPDLGIKPRSPMSPALPGGLFNCRATRKPPYGSLDALNRDTDILFWIYCLQCTRNFKFYHHLNFQVSVLRYHKNTWSSKRLGRDPSKWICEDQEIEPC